MNRYDLYEVVTPSWDVGILPGGNWGGWRMRIQGALGLQYANDVNNELCA